MNERARLLKIAAAELGYREGSNNDTKYGAWYGLNRNPWCLMFICWCAAQAGIGESVIPRLAYCPYAVAWFQSRGRFIKALPGRTPQAGDLLFFGSTEAEHVGLVEQVSSGRISTIEGNRGDRVQRCSYAAGAGGLLGWGRPAYKEDNMEIQNIGIYLSDADRQVQVSGLLLDNVTYVRLRDAEKLFPVSVAWDAQRGLACVKQNFKEV